jgi:hypothetical protein
MQILIASPRSCVDVTDGEVTSSCKCNIKLMSHPHVRSTAGLRSGKYAAKLQREGFRDVRNLHGSLVSWVRNCTRYPRCYRLLRMRVLEGRPLSPVLP